MKLPHLTTEEHQQFEHGVIQVNGKAHNRTVLGIIDAFLQLFPDSTLEELKKAIPDELNPTAHPSPKTIFKPHTDRPVGFVHSITIKEEFAKADIENNFDSVFFNQPDEIFTLKSGEKVVVVKMIDKAGDKETGVADLETLANHVKQYGIVVNKFEERDAFKKGGYSIQKLNNDLFNKISGQIQVVEKEVIIEKEVIKEKKVIPFWVWIVLALALIPLILWLFGVFKSEPVIVEKTIIKTNTIQKTDTIYIQEIETIESKFNSVQFKVGNADLPEDAKYALYDLVKVMEKQQKIKISIKGHTSKEGNLDFNQQLSEKRAKAVVDFLVSRGVSLTRLSFEGKGSSEPIDINNNEINRRTEFVIN
jgi:outer membrane protein OmpA-like peptidoglycan-associated protein